MASQAASQPQQSGAVAPESSAREAAASGTGGGSLRTNYLINKPLGINDVPFHRDVGGDQEWKPDLGEFIRQILREGKDVDVQSWEATGTKKFKDNKIPDVQKFKKSESGGDVWFARLSQHADKEAENNEEPILFAEMDYGLRKNHSRHEGLYTPDIFDVNVVLQWDLSELDSVSAVGGWRKVSMYVVEIYHKLPSPLNNRIFAELVVSGVRADCPSLESLAGKTGPATINEFVVVQLPVHLSTFPEEFLKKRSHLDWKTRKYSPSGPEFKPGMNKVRSNKIVQGAYASVEKVSRICDSSSLTQTPNIHIIWQMGTASDAAGWLPQSIQRPAVPNKIAEDVQFFLDYAQKHGKDAGWPRNTPQEPLVTELKEAYTWKPNEALGPEEMKKRAERLSGRRRSSAEVVEG